MALRPTTFFALIFLSLGLSRAALCQPALDQRSAARDVAAQEAAHQKLRRLGFNERVATYVRESEIPCTVKNALDRSFVVEQVEVSCAEGRGYLISIIGGLTAAADCLTTETGELRCKLPENKHAEREVMPFLSQAGLSCDPTKARFAGIRKEHQTTLFEVTCSEGGDYIISIPNNEIVDVHAPQVDKTTTWLDCLEGPSLCKYTDHIQQVQRFARSIGVTLKPPCEIEDARYVGILPPQPLDIYEVSCRGGSGFLVETTTTQQLVHSLACADAGSIKTSCKLHHIR